VNSPAADLPAGADAPVFAEPWQAEAFAMTIALHEKGLFSWSEWADALSAEVKQPGAASDGHDYYEHWLAALEKPVGGQKASPARSTSTRSPPPGNAPRTPRRTANRFCWRMIPDSAARVRAAKRSI
jgi:nitrile hydratase accessory protein